MTVYYVTVGPVSQARRAAWLAVSHTCLMYNYTSKYDRFLQGAAKIETASYRGGIMMYTTSTNNAASSHNMD